MRTVGIILGAAIVIFLAYIALSVLVDGYFGGNMWIFSTKDSWAAPDSWSEWRDIVIVFTAGFWLLSGLVMLVLVVVLVILAFQIRSLLRENVAPAVDSLRDSLDHVRGTTEFASETVISPFIRLYSITKGVRSGLGAVTNLPNRIKGQQKKGRKK
jgi:hypothetical protein